MNDTSWLTFADEIAYLRKPFLTSSGMITIYHTRKSYIESLFEGVILVPRRAVTSELQVSGFRFMPPQYPRRLIKNSQYHFLGQPIRRFAQLTTLDWHRYTDSAHKIAAERRKNTDVGQQETQHITLRRDILFTYCDQHHLVPIWVTDSLRFSERALEEFGISSERTDTSDTSFSYFLQLGLHNPQSRPRMSSFSLLCGKCLLPNPALITE